MLNTKLKESDKINCIFLLIQEQKATDTHDIQENENKKNCQVGQYKTLYVKLHPHKCTLLDFFLMFYSIKSSLFFKFMPFPISPYYYKMITSSHFFCLCHSTLYIYHKRETLTYIIWSVAELLWKIGTDLI